MCYVVVMSPVQRQALGAVVFFVRICQIFIKFGVFVRFSCQGFFALYFAFSKFLSIVGK